MFSSRDIHSWVRNYRFSRVRRGTSSRKTNLQPGYIARGPISLKANVEYSLSPPTEFSIPIEDQKTNSFKHMKTNLKKAKATSFWWTICPIWWPVVESDRRIIQSTYVDYVLQNDTGLIMFTSVFAFQTTSIRVYGTNHEKLLIQENLLHITDEFASVACDLLYKLAIITFNHAINTYTYFIVFE